MSKKNRSRSRTTSGFIALGLDNRIEKKSSVSGDEKGKFGAPGRAVIMLSVMIFSVFVIGVIANWRSLSSLAARNSGIANPVPLPSPPTLPSNAPSKEYIYAGSSLISTVEPFRELPSDIAVWRPGNGVFYALNGQGSTFQYTWGVSSDVPAPADYDGDGKTDVAIFRPSDTQFFIVYSSNEAFTSDVYGISSDKPVPADYDGDGRSDVALWRQSTQQFFVHKSSDGGYLSSSLSSVFGSSTTDVATPGDYDGDGKTDYAVWRGSNATFYALKSSDGQIMTYSIGANGDEPVVGDYDGDSKTDVAVRRPSDNYWRIHFSGGGSDAAINWGVSGDIAVPARYNDASDTDTKTDIAVWRPSNGTWHIRRSTDGSTRQTQFGLSGDIPVPSNWRR